MVQELKEKDDAALREQVICMAQEAGFDAAPDGHIYPDDSAARAPITEAVARFAALVAKRAVSNIDPASSMSYQEGYAAGAAAEREAVWKILFDYAGREDLSDSDQSLLTHLADLIRARGEK